MFIIYAKQAEMSRLFNKNCLFSSSAISLQTEIEVIKSRFLIEKAIKNIDFSTKYFVFNNLKKIELYKNTPFTVDIENKNDL